MDAIRRIQSDVSLVSAILRKRPYDRFVSLSGVWFFRIVTDGIAPVSHLAPQEIVFGAAVELDDPNVRPHKVQAVLALGVRHLGDERPGKLLKLLTADCPIAAQLGE